MKTSIEKIAVILLKVNMAAFIRLFKKSVISNLAVLLLGIRPKEIMEMQYSLVIKGSTYWSCRPHLNPDSTTNLLCGLDVS